jgi:hypothetical protein
MDLAGNKRQFQKFRKSRHRGLPQLAVRAMKEGVAERERWSRPMRGAPSEPLKDDPEPDTQRYLVETV